MQDLVQDKVGRNSSSSQYHNGLGIPLVYPLGSPGINCYLCMTEPRRGALDGTHFTRGSRDALFLFPFSRSSVSFRRIPRPSIPAFSDTLLSRKPDPLVASFPEMPFIPGLWDVVGRGVITPIAVLADETLRERKRPFRVAIDAASLYAAYKHNPPTITRPGNNYFYRTETAILFRLADLITRNVCPILVFDGSHAVLRRTLTGDSLELLRVLAKKLGVRCVNARGEAEADCARLENMGCVDAVWSEEGLAVIYGAKRVVRETAEPVLEKRSSLLTHFVEDEDDLIESYCWLRRHTSIIYGYLVGGQYGDTTLEKLRRCSPDLAKSVVSRYRQDIKSKAWVNTNEAVTSISRVILQRTLQVLAPGISLPLDFPTARATKMLDNSRVSPDDCLEMLFDNDDQWQPKINEEGLQLSMRRELNLCNCDYATRICPAILNSRLQASTFGHERLDLPTNFYYGSSSIPTTFRVRPIDTYAGLPIDLVVWFRARSVSYLDISKCDNGDCHPGVPSAVPDEFVPSSVLTRMVEELLTANDFETMTTLILPRQSAELLPTDDTYADELPSQLLLQGQSVVPLPADKAGLNRKPDQLLFLLRQVLNDRAVDSEECQRDNAASTSRTVQAAVADIGGYDSDQGIAKSSSSAGSSSSHTPTSTSTSASLPSTPPSSTIKLRSASGRSLNNIDKRVQPATRPMVVIPESERLTTEERAETIVHLPPSAASSQSRSDGSATSQLSSVTKTTWDARNSKGQFITKEAAQRLGKAAQEPAKAVRQKPSRAILPSASTARAVKRRRAHPETESVERLAPAPRARASRRTGGSDNYILESTSTAPTATRAHGESYFNDESDSDQSDLIFVSLVKIEPGQPEVTGKLGRRTRPNHSVRQEKPVASRPAFPPSTSHAESPDVTLHSQNTFVRGPRPSAGMSAEARGEQPRVYQEDGPNDDHDDSDARLEHLHSDPNSPHPPESGSHFVAGPSDRNPSERPLVNQDDDSHDLPRRLSDMPVGQSGSASALSAVVHNYLLSNHFGYSASSAPNFHLPPSDELRADGFDYNKRLYQEFGQTPTTISQMPATFSQPPMPISQPQTAISGPLTTITQPQTPAERIINPEASMTDLGAYMTRMQADMTANMTRIQADMTNMTRLQAEMATFMANFADSRNSIEPKGSGS